MDRREMSWEGVDWIPVGHGRNHWRALVNMTVNLCVPQKAWDFLTI
jgi:hypothetical protein